MTETHIYLDNASTAAPKSDVVWLAARDYIRDIGASPGRGNTRLGRRAHEVVEDARRTIADLIGVGRATQLAFTANATHALNIAIQGVLRPGDHVVTTKAEHNSVLRPLEALARSGKITYTAVPPSAAGRFDMSLFRKAVRRDTRLLVVNHASNVTGAVAPLAELMELARDRGTMVLVDAAQTAGLLPVDADVLGIDLVAVTGHKWLGGPPGTGGLFVRDPAQVAPLVQGGTGSSSHALVQPAAMPAKFEAGTVNYVGIAGLGAAARLLGKEMQEVHRAAMDLTGYCRQGLKRIPETVVYEAAPDVAGAPVLSFNLASLYPSELCALLDERYGISTRAGLHCAPLMHEVLGTLPHGTVRVSIGRATTSEQIDALLAAVTEVQRGRTGVPNPGG